MKDTKPDVWVGHVFMKSRDISETSDFLIKIGMRKLFGSSELGIFELRGGTHLAVEMGDPELKDGETYFDLMVEDLDQTREKLINLDLDPSDIIVGEIHRTFMIDEPGGNRVRFNDSHVSKGPV